MSKAPTSADRLAVLLNALDGPVNARRPTTAKRAGRRCVPVVRHPPGTAHRGR